MKEHPIIFSTEMVKVILEKCKTQTRRIFKGTTEHKEQYSTEYLERWHGDAGWKSICPYGQVGDRLWVRETWRPAWAVNPAGMSGPGIQYKADGEIYGRVEAGRKYPECQFSPKKWRPSIHMPRWASRITLEIIEIKVQRVQEISEDDAIAEGFPKGDILCADGKLHSAAHPIFWYQELWDSINAKRGYGWDVNPWVWAITFKEVNANGK